jgi:hypothetical protein
MTVTSASLGRFEWVIAASSRNPWFGQTAGHWSPIISVALQPALQPDHPAWPVATAGPAHSGPLDCAWQRGRMARQTPNAKLVKRRQDAYERGQRDLIDNCLVVSG